MPPRPAAATAFPTNVANPLQCCRESTTGDTWHKINGGTADGHLGYRTYGNTCRNADGTTGCGTGGATCTYGPCGSRNMWGGSGRGGTTTSKMFVPTSSADGLRVPVLQRSDVRHGRLSRDLREPDPVRGRHRELHVHHLQPRRHRRLHQHDVHLRQGVQHRRPTTSSACASRSPATATPLRSARHGGQQRDRDQRQPDRQLQADSGAVYVFVRSGGDLEPAGLHQGVEHRRRRRVRLQRRAVGRRQHARGRRPGEDSNATGINGNQADNSASDAGAVYVFTRSGTTWTQQAYVKASNTASNDYFGDSRRAVVRRQHARGRSRRRRQQRDRDQRQQSDTRRRAAARSTCSPARARPGASRRMSRRPTPGADDPSADRRAVGRRQHARGRRSHEDSNATGIDGNQSTIPVGQRRGLRVHPLRHDLEPAGVHQGVEHRTRIDYFGDERRAVGRRQHARGRCDERTAPRPGSTATRPTTRLPRCRRGLRVHALGHDLEPQAMSRRPIPAPELVFRQGGASLSTDGNLLVVGAHGRTALPPGSTATRRSLGWSRWCGVSILRFGSSWYGPLHQGEQHRDSPTNSASPSGVSGDGKTIAVGAPCEASSATGIGGNQADNSLSGAGAVYLIE